MVRRVCPAAGSTRPGQRPAAAAVGAAPTGTAPGRGREHDEGRLRATLCPLGTGACGTGRVWRDGSLQGDLSTLAKFAKVRTRCLSCGGWVMSWVISNLGCTAGAAGNPPPLPPPLPLKPIAPWRPGGALSFTVTALHSASQVKQSQERPGADALRLIGRSIAPLITSSSMSF